MSHRVRPTRDPSRQHGPTPTPHDDAPTRPIGGFSLIELLVVISVVSILTTTSLVALEGARQSAQSAIAMANVRRLVFAQTTYAQRYAGWLAGPNTSGVVGLLDRHALEGDTTPTTPTTTHDWISPVLGDELRLSPNRAERTAEIFERLACPRARHHASLLWGRARDLSDFERVLERRGFLQISYLAPAAFHYRPEGGYWTPRRLRGTRVPPHTAIGRPYRAPARYRPRLDAIERPHAKALVADGTRYLANGPRGLTLDFDVTPDPTIYGSFTSSGPIYHASRAYGRAYAARFLAGAELNIDHSMRYFDREMHVAHFDGHAERLGAGRVWGDPGAWYPSASRYVPGADVTPEVAGLFAAHPERYGRID